MKMQKTINILLTLFIFLSGLVYAGHNNHYDQILDGFADPGKEYAPRPLWWWVGEKIEKDRVAWQLDQLKEKGVLHPIVVYSHAPRKFSVGKVYQVDPEPFTEEWWDIFDWTMKECEKRGMTLSFSEYVTFNKVQRRLIQEHPELASLHLGLSESEITGPDVFDISVPDNIVHLQAYELKSGKIDYQKSVNLLDYMQDGRKIKWVVPDGKWLITRVSVNKNRWALSGTEPLVGQLLIDNLYDPFRQLNPEEFGKTYVSFFQDELLIGMNGWPFPVWKDDFEEQFMKRKGYDITEYLPALWKDIGDITPKARMDYYDVAIALIEEAYFIPIHNYMEKHNVLYAHDQGGRGNTMAATVQYGDYIRTQRWYNAPGNDCYGGSFNFKDTKLSSSIANIYERPVVWLESFHASGWGMTSGNMLKWLNQHYAAGANLFNKHGLYYTTYGGWWEWAPPDAHFRQPYWFNAEVFSMYVSRLSYILRQGVHACDVAIVYPSSTMYAEVVNKGSSLEERFSEKAFQADKDMWGTARYIFDRGIDLDYIHEQALGRAGIAQGKIEISGINYKSLLLPSLSAISRVSARKAQELYRNGGLVIFYKSLPLDSMEAGRNDPKLYAIYKDMFGSEYNRLQRIALNSESENSPGHSSIIVSNNNGGVCAFIPDDYENISQLIDQSIERDFIPSRNNIFVHHRKINNIDAYFVCNNNQENVNVELSFAHAGTPEIWDAWSGEVKPVYRTYKKDQRAVLPLSFEPGQGRLIIFRDQPLEFEVLKDDYSEIHQIKRSGEGIKVVASYADSAKKNLTIRSNDKIYRDSRNVKQIPSPVFLEGAWDFELVPTLDNQWGDFRLPATDSKIGAEVRRFKYYMHDGSKNYVNRFIAADYDDSDWPMTTYSYGQTFWKSGPFDEDVNCRLIEEKMLSLDFIDKHTFLSVDGKSVGFEEYDISYRWGIELDPVLLRWSTGPHGLKKKVPDEFIDLYEGPKPVYGVGGPASSPSPPGSVFYLWTTININHQTLAKFNFGSMGPATVWLNGEKVIEASDNDKQYIVYGYPEIGTKAEMVLQLNAGVNRILLKFVQPDEGRIRAYAVFRKTDYDQGLDLEPQEIPALHLSWFADSRSLLFNPNPADRYKVGWYRFKSPPNLESMNFKAYGENLEVWIDGNKAEVTSKKLDKPGLREYNVKVDRLNSDRNIVAIRLKYHSGRKGGHAIPEPIKLECGKGKIQLVSWSDMGLPDYSGAAMYSKTFTITNSQLNDQVILDLGDVRDAADVRINNKRVKVKFAGPWRFDISEMLFEGQNIIDVYVTNTVENHYVVNIPSPYARHDRYPVSGLLGPVRLEFYPTVTLSLSE